MQKATLRPSVGFCGRLLRASQTKPMRTELPGDPKSSQEKVGSTPQGRRIISSWKERAQNSHRVWGDNLAWDLSLAPLGPKPKPEVSADL